MASPEPVRTRGHATRKGYARRMSEACRHTRKLRCGESTSCSLTISDYPTQTDRLHIIATIYFLLDIRECGKRRDETIMNHLHINVPNLAAAQSFFEKYFD